MTMTQQPIGNGSAHQPEKEPDDGRAVLSFLEFNWGEQPLEYIFEKVERAKQEWETTVDSLPEVVCLVDQEGHIIRANRTVETWGLGQVTTVRGLDIHALMHPGCASPFCALDRFLQQAREKADEGQPDELEAYDAILGRHLLVRVRPVSEKKDVTTRTSVVVAQDISERKKTEQALRRYNQRLEVMNDIQKAILAAHSPEAIAQAALSHIRQLIPFHQALVALYISQSDEFLVLAADAGDATDLRLGQSLPGKAFRSEERQPEKFFAVGDLAQHPNTTDMEQQLLKDGMHSYVSIPMIAKGEFIGSLNLGSSELDAFNCEHIGIACQVGDLLAIATRQAQLHGEVKLANTELQEALQAKDQMVQNVSHELRTPLTVLYGYTELLADAALGPLELEQKEAVQIMREQTERLRFMVDQLLALRTFDASKLERAQLDLGTWLQQVMRRWEARLARPTPGIQFQLELSCPLPPLIADPDWLSQVILNLLDNAVKFSPRGGLGRVRAWAEKDHIILSVSDEGIGIPVDKLQELFEPFFQVDGSKRRRFGGMGIGLALCRIIVEAHGGRIWAESLGKGQGSTFYVALPVGARKEKLDDIER
jgi:PAS domain S-box-containing protein